MSRALVLACVALLAPSLAAAEAGSAQLVVECPVDGAAVDIDGRFAGKTPLPAVTVAPGAHTLVVKKAGYVEHHERVEARRGATTRVVADLLPLAGALDGGDATVDLELDLVPLAPVAAQAGGREAPAAELDLELVPLAPAQPDAAPTPEVVEAPPAAGAPEPSPFVAPAVSPPTPWYMRYWVWGAAAGAVVAGGVAVALATQGGGDSGPDVQSVWALQAGWTKQ